MSPVEGRRQDGDATQAELHGGAVHAAGLSEAQSGNIHSACRSGSFSHSPVFFTKMSGIEIAGLAFGVLPILIEVVKSYSTVSKKVHTLRHYSKEIKSISAQLKVHNGIFLNEVRLLLRSIEDEDEVESMLEDAADGRWTSRQLNEKLRTVLRDSFDICHSVIEEMRETIEVMREEMAKFDVLLDQKSKVSVVGPCGARVLSLLMNIFSRLNIG